MLSRGVWLLIWAVVTVTAKKVEEDVVYDGSDTGYPPAEENYYDAYDAMSDDVDDLENVFWEPFEIEYFTQNRSNSPIQYISDYYSFDFLKDLPFWGNITQFDQLLTSFHSVVHLRAIYKYDESGKTQAFSSTAYFIGPITLGTAGHNVVQCKCRDAGVKKYSQCDKDGKCSSDQFRLTLNEIVFCPNEYGCSGHVSYSASVKERSNTGNSYGWGVTDDVAILESQDYKSPYYIKLRSLSKYEKLEKIDQVVIIGYPYLKSISRESLVRVGDHLKQQISGQDYALFYHDGPYDIVRRTLMIANVTDTKFKETKYHNGGSSGGVSGGAALIVGDEGGSVGVHVGGSAKAGANTFITTDHPLLQKYVINEKDTKSGSDLKGEL